jgi:hypothetical protein
VPLHIAPDVQTPKDERKSTMMPTEIKKTKLLVAELRMIADTIANQYCKDIILEAAQRLEDTHKIAVFYRNKVESDRG